MLNFKSFEDHYIPLSPKFIIQEIVFSNFYHILYLSFELQAVEELFKLMQLMVMKHPDATESDQREIYSFRKTTLMTYLQCLDGRTSWTTLINAFRILLETNDDKLYVVYNGGLQIVFEVRFLLCHQILSLIINCF